MEQKPSVFRSILEWVVIIAIALVVGSFIRTFVAMPFVVPTGSMEHTIEIGDQLVAEKVTLSLGPARICRRCCGFHQPGDRFRS